MLCLKYLSPRFELRPSEIVAVPLANAPRPLGRIALKKKAMLQSRAVKIVGGTVVYVAGVGFAYEMSRPIPKLPSCGERCCTFNQLAPKYDQEIEKDEATSGIADLRKAMAAQASGKVLEVAGGTGRNLRYYGSNVKSLLITDYSEAMLTVAARKVADA